MAVTLTQGTKEYLLFEIVDQLKVLTTLSGTNPRFDVKNQANTFLYTGQPADFTGMTMECLINSDVDGPTLALWPAGDYRIYPIFDVAPERPRLGPFTFTISAA